MGQSKCHRLKYLLSPSFSRSWPQKGCALSPHHDSSPQQLSPHRSFSMDGKQHTGGASSHRSASSPQRGTSSERDSSPQRSAFSHRGAFSQRGASSIRMRPYGKVHGSQHGPRTWWSRVEQREFYSGVDFAEDSEDGGGDDYELMPESDEEGRAGWLKFVAEDKEFVPETEPQSSQDEGKKTTIKEQVMEDPQLHIDGISIDIIIYKTRMTKNHQQVLILWQKKRSKGSSMWTRRRCKFSASLGWPSSAEVLLRCCCFIIICFFFNWQRV